MRRTTQLSLFGLLLLLSSIPPTNAREPQTLAQNAIPKQNPSQRKVNPSAPTIRRQVNEITTPVTVVDKQGNFILDLKQKDFHVFDNGVEQHIDRWSVDDRPLALALIVENSSHVDMMAREIRINGIVVTETLMAEDGEAAVIDAGDAAELRQPFTTNHDAVEKAIQRLPFADDNMHLYDAMLEGALLAKQPDTSHRVLLVIAEAQDGGSKHKLGEVLQVAQHADVSIYTIGLSSTAADLRSDPVPHDPDDDLDVTSGGNPVPQPANTPQGVLNPVPQVGSTGAPGVGGGIDLLSLAVFLVQRVEHIRKSHAMGAAVAFTGGAYFHPFRDRNIQDALGDIAGQLHSEYLLSYQLQGAVQPGVHQIEVRVDRPQLIVRARLGYYLAQAND